MLEAVSIITVQMVGARDSHFNKVFLISLVMRKSILIAVKILE